MTNGWIHYRPLKRPPGQTGHRSAMGQHKEQQHPQLGPSRGYVFVAVNAHVGDVLGSSCSRFCRQQVAEMNVSEHPSGMSDVQCDIPVACAVT